MCILTHIGGLQIIFCRIILRNWKPPLYFMLLSIPAPIIYKYILFTLIWFSFVFVIFAHFTFAISLLRFFFRHSDVEPYKSCCHNGYCQFTFCIFSKIAYYSNLFKLLWVAFNSSDKLCCIPLYIFSATNWIQCFKTVNIHIKYIESPLTKTIDNNENIEKFPNKNQRKILK